MDFTDSPQSPHGPDVLGEAILHAWRTGENTPVELTLNGVSDDPMDAAVFLRSPDEWEPMEYFAINHSHGEILDLGAGGGSHSLALQDLGESVTALESSPAACKVLKERGVKHIVQCDVMEWKTEARFDTILLLMNGMGMGQRADRTGAFLDSLKKLLKPGGSILGEGTDVRYMADAWKQVPRSYYGDVIFEVKRGGQSQRFDWVYIDEKRLALEAQAVGLQCEILTTGPTFNYLARLY